MQKTILVTGGAGYIGSVLVRLLLEKKYHVRVLDNLKFGGDSIVDLLNNKNFEFLKGDIRNIEDVKKSLKGVFAVAHLAAIVGDPACSKFREEAKSVNVQATKLLYREANKLGVKRFVFASTCSNYGKMKDSSLFITEESELNPISLYAETKVSIENFLLNQDVSNICKPTCLRFSTVYGVSPRLRFDLTVNEFTKELALNRSLDIFGEQFWRPYCHVVDLSRSVISVIEARDSYISFEVFNVGDTKENYQKQMIIEEIKKQIPNSKINYFNKDEDPRDYRVNFDKISNKLGFKISMTVPEGIAQIKDVVINKLVSDPDNQKFKNV